MYRPVEDTALRATCPLGQGGTAEVVRAFHIQINKPVAVKYALTDPELSTEKFAGLVRREYALIGGYRFPGLVRPLTDPSPEFDHLVLELCAGPTLDKVARIDDLAAAMNIISAAALDLEFLRAVGLIHGDLKPHNLFLPEAWSSLRSDQLFFLKLSDFSLGRRNDEPESVRLGLGTIGYMAPETIREHRTSHCSDLFALGVIAYQLLTGRHPFHDDGTDPVKINSHICEHTPKSPSALRPDVPEELSDLVMQLLSKTDSERPQSGWQVCEMLEQVGAQYPFRKALRPAFLFRADDSFDGFIERHLALSEPDHKRLLDLTDGKTENLRLLLTGNFIRDRLKYVDGKFRLDAPAYWPCAMRRRTLSWFSKADWSAKRIAVRTAVVGGNDALACIEPTRAWPEAAAPAALTGLLQQLLRPRTIETLSAHLATVAYRQNAHELACRLHMQAGNLTEAERCAELAAATMTKENHTPEALALLLALDRHARLTGREYDIRRALKLKGTIHKDVGELDQAEKEYLRVIQLYDKRPVDKLLAETYKYLGDVYRLRQKSKLALEALDKSLAVFRDLGDELEISHTLTNIGNVHWYSDDTRRALAFYREAYKIQKRLKAKPDIASTLQNIASVCCVRGQMKRGIFLFNHTLSLKREIGNLGEIARTLNNLGYAHQVAGSRAKAADSLTEALQINRQIGSKKEILYNLENLVAVRVTAGELEKSHTLIDEGLSLAKASNLMAHEASMSYYQAYIFEREGRFNDSLRSLDKVTSILATLDDYFMSLRSEIRKASIRRGLGDYASALTIAQKVHCAASEAKSTVAKLESLLLLVRLTDDSQYWESANKMVIEQRLNRERRVLWFGRLEFLLEAGDVERAFDFAKSLVDELVDPESDIERPWMLNLAGVVYLNRQERRQAASRFETARGLAETAGLVPELITSITMLGQIAKIEGNYEKAFAFARRGLSLCRQVAESIPDPADQKLFLARPLVQSLAIEIKTLGQRLGQKAKADL